MNPKKLVISYVHNIGGQIKDNCLWMGGIEAEVCALSKTDLLKLEEE